MGPLTSTALVALLTVTAPARGQFSIPKGHPDGVFDVSFDEGGSPVIQRIGNLTELPAEWTGHFNQLDHHVHENHDPRRRRDLANGANCRPSGAILTANDIAQAGYSLGIACDAAVSSGHGDSFIPAGSLRYAQAGDATAYVCNYSSKNTQHCYYTEVINAFDALYQKCDQTVAGLYNYQKWAKSYGYDSKEATMCWTE